jgi:hypothetical protein
MPGSVDGVNPAYHKRIFANPTIARAYGFVDTGRAARERANQ